MDSEKLFDLFVTFLKVNNAYENYINNFKRQGFSNFESYDAKKNFSGVRIHNWISIFIWARSTKGVDYWSNLVYKWSKLISSLGIPYNVKYKYPNPIKDRPNET